MRRGIANRAQFDPTRSSELSRAGSGGLAIVRNTKFCAICVADVDPKGGKVGKNKMFTCIKHHKEAP